MPKTKSETPEKLRPYIFHGIDLTYAEGDKEALGDCLFCNAENHFSVDAKTGKFRCLKCAESGNAITFIRELWKLSDEKTTDYNAFAEDRKLQYPDTLMKWGLAKSIATYNWLVPGWNAKGKLCQLYRYVETENGMRLLPTPTLGHQLFGVDLYDKKKDVVFLCEGPWDAMTLWETLGNTKEDAENERLVSTANPKSSLLAESNVLGIPGCNVFFPKWVPLFTGKTVNLMFDNDHPRRHSKTGKEIPPAGLTGMKRVARILSEAEKPPTEINYLKWGSEGFNTDLPHGFDVRDTINA